MNSQLTRGGWRRRAVPYGHVTAAWEAVDDPSVPPDRTVALRIPPLDITHPAYGLAEGRLLGALEGLAACGGAIRHVLLHGSLASRDFTGYSDVDALLVVEDAVVGSEASFLETRQAVRRALRAVLTYDPLQHHGFQVLPASLLVRYPESYLPVSVWHTMTAVGARAPVELTLEVVPSMRVCGALRNMVATLATYRTVPRSAYDAKLFLSMFMLLPALALQAVGRETDKASSFATLARVLTDVDWEPMVWASGVRRSWVRQKASPIERLLLTNLNPWLVSRTILRRRSMAAATAAAWTAERHAALRAFVRRIAAWGDVLETSPDR